MGTNQQFKTYNSGHLPPVSKRFRRDWQYILKVSRTPALKSASLVIAIAPLISSLETYIPISLLTFWLTWTSSVLVLFALFLVFVFCPPFVSEYSDYSDYEKFKHSHRWILWSLHLNLAYFRDHKNVLKETIDKELSYPLDVQNGLNNLPINKKDAEEKISSMKNGDVFTPINKGRDILYIFKIYDKPYLLQIKEIDPNLKQKEKELFWIIQSALVKTRLIRRYFIWTIYAFSLVVFATSLSINIYRPLEKPVQTLANQALQFIGISI